MFSAAKRNAPEPQVGSSTESFADGFEEREEQVGRGIFHHVLRELADVEIERDEVVDGADFAGAQLALKLLAALAAGDGLAPDFRRQAELGRGGFVPAGAALAEVGLRSCRCLSRCSPAAASGALSFSPVG